ncbi:hypothetical protein [Embleya sp. NBC_00896]|uniref:hypothetical protein n=1 Tax=Embleya sp. NBC_00896 TaxID=2975961 RepID=UPI00386B7E71|nr:hypothetical protein OG928_32815 [Embleya sp. NBC_00896]
MMNDTYESRSRLLLRAYPRRYRSAREAELLGTLLDAAPPGATRPSIPEAWDIVRGGLTTRLRDRPPPHHWLAYRLLGKRVPHRYRMWVRDDALGRFLFVRRNLGSYLIAFGVVWLGTILGGPGYTPLPAPGPWRWAFLALLALGILNPLYSMSFRTRILHKHDFVDDGTDPTSSRLPRHPDQP